MISEVALSSDGLDGAPMGLQGSAELVETADALSPLPAFERAAGALAALPGVHAARIGIGATRLAGVLTASSGHVGGVLVERSFTIDEAKTAVQAVKDLKLAFQMVMDERTRIEKLRKQVAGVVHGHDLDAGFAMYDTATVSTGAIIVSVSLYGGEASTRSASVLALLELGVPRL